MRKGEGSELGRWEKCVRVMRWEKWEDSEVARLERWEGSEVASWERWEGRWKSIEMGRWEVSGFIQGSGSRVGPRFHLFVSVNQQNEGGGCVQDFLAWPQEWKDSP